MVNYQQGYLSSATGQRKGADNTTTQDKQATESSGSYVPPVQGTTTSVINTATDVLASAKAAAQNAMGTVTASAQNILGTAGTQGAQVKDMPASSTGIPATSAPLESGPHKLDSPYPSTTTTVGTKDIGQNESKKTIN